MKRIAFILCVISQSVTLNAQPDLTLKARYLPNQSFGKISFSATGNIYYITSGQDSIGYLDYEGLQHDLTPVFTAKGFSQFTEILHSDNLLYVGTPDQGLIILSGDSLFQPPAFREKQALDINSIEKVSSQCIDIDGDFVVDTTEYNVGTNKGFFAATHGNPVDFVQVEMFDTQNRECIVYNDFGVWLIGPKKIDPEVVSWWWMGSCPEYAFSSTTPLDKNDMLASVSESYANPVWPYLHVATDTGVIFKYHHYDSTFLRQLLSMRTNDLHVLTIYPNSIIDVVEESQYLLMGTENGLYYTDEFLQYKDGKAEIFHLADTEHINVNDMDVNLCGAEIWLATDQGLYRISSFVDKTLIPYVGDRISPKGEIKICQNEGAMLQADLGDLYNIQWQRNNENLPGKTGETLFVDSPGTYRFEVSNCYFEQSQYSEEVIVYLDSTVNFEWNYGEEVTLCNAGENLWLDNSSGNFIEWYLNDSLVGTGSSIPVYASGIYTSKVINCNGYFDWSSPVTVKLTEIEGPVINLSSGDLCKGDVVTVTLDNYAVGEIRWLIDDQVVDSLTNQIRADLTNFSSIVVEILQQGCTYRSTTNYAEFHDYPSIEVDRNYHFCEGDSLTFTFSEEYEYYLDGMPTANEFTISKPGNFMLDVKTRFDCTSTYEIEVFKHPVPSFLLPDDTIFCEFAGMPITITLPEGYSAYYWNDTLNNQHYHNFSEPGIYEVGVYTEWGCYELKTLEIKSFCEELIIPNAFTPNGDGKNDFFEIANLIPDCRLIVYDRDSREVFRSDSYQNDWDGGSQDGVFYYYLNCRQIDRQYTGHLIILN